VKNLGIVLGVVAFVIAWGLLGKTQSDKIGNSCKAEVGPLCFVWEKNAVGKAEDAIGDIVGGAKSTGSK
jgi:hypothetical protein